MSAADPILITGCSSGIGRATAEHLARGGRTVYATGRRLDSLAGLERAGCRVLALDVLDEVSMQAAVDVVQAAHGAVGALVNNAGYGVSGAIEAVSVDAVRTESRPTCSVTCAWRSWCCRGCGGPAGAGSSTSARWPGGDPPRRRGLRGQQVRDRGDQRRLALRGAGLRGRGDRDRARPDPHRVHLQRQRLAGAGLPGPTPGITPPWPRPTSRPTRASSPASPSTWHGRSSAR